MKTQHVLLAVTSMVLLGFADISKADWYYNPATDHYYTLTTPAYWQDAEAEAVTLGGHLVTINDQAENDWVLDTFGDLGNSTAKLWIGLYQTPGSPEPDDGWVWISGEPVTYTNWNVGEPNTDDKYPSEDFGHIWDSQLRHVDEVPGSWNDFQGDFQPVPGIVESTVPEPATLSLLALGGLAMLRRRR